MNKRSGSGSELKKEAREILIVWLALMGLLATTVAVAFIPLGIANTVVGLIIATLKVSLVAYFYMKLRSSSVYVRTVGLIGVFTISLLFMFSAVDYVSRFAPAAPWQ